MIALMKRLEIISVAIINYQFEIDLRMFFLGHPIGYE